MFIFWYYEYMYVKGIKFIEISEVRLTYCHALHSNRKDPIKYSI